MPDLEKVMRGLECCSQQRGGPELCDVQCPYYNEPFPCGNTLLHDALDLLKERGPKVKPQFDDDALDRNAYVKVGDLIDCMTELSMPEDAAFHLTGAIEWACGKRAVALPKEQEPRVMTEDEVLHSTGKPLWFENRGMYLLGKKGFWCLSFEVDPESHIKFIQPLTGGRLTLSMIDYGKTWRVWDKYQSPEQMWDTPWEGEKK